jgi:predicted RNase H-like nuclease
MSEQVLAIGVDGARGGWLAALGYGSDPDGEVERVALQLVPRFADLAGLRSEGALAAVDIPMGLLETVTPRACDTKRASSSADAPQPSSRLRRGHCWSQRPTPMPAG